MGIALGPVLQNNCRMRVPQVCGDDPKVLIILDIKELCSPIVWGCLKS